MIIIALIIASGPIVAGERKNPDRISLGENTTESVVPELAKIVVLCATDEEEKFEKEWSKYVVQYDLRGAELKKTISWVSDEASIQRKKNRQMHGEEYDDKAWKAKRKKMMDELARQAIML